MTGAPIPKRNKPFVASYTRIAEDLRTRVRDGVLTPGQMLPGMRHLAKDYGVAVGTVQQAIAMLVAEGTLVSDGWRGTSVAELSDDGDGQSLPDDREPLVDSHKLRSTLQKTVGVIAGFPLDADMVGRHASDLWQVVVVNAIEHELSLKPGVRVRFMNLFCPDGSTRTPSSAARSLIDDGADAVIAVSSSDDPEDEPIALAVGRLPLVVATIDIPPRAVPFVAHDDFSAGFDAVAHLVSLGWNSFVFVAPYDETCIWQEQRIAGALEAVRRLRVPSEQFRVYRGPLPSKSRTDVHDIGDKHASRLISDQLVEDHAIIAANDNLAYAFRSALLEQGLTPGTDYALLGFDNRYPSLEIGLTSFARPLQGIGEQAARLIVKELRGVGTMSQVWLRSRLIARTSTRARRSILSTPNALK